MKPRTRDNLIYLTVGLGLAALVAADAFYADGHGTKMWMPSRDDFRLAYSTPLLAYFVIRETRKVNATPFQILGCVVFASLVHLMIWVGFRQALGELSGMAFTFWFVAELFILVELLAKVIPHLRSERG